MLTHAFLVLAQTEAPGKPGGQPSPADGLISMLMLIVPLLLVWYFLILRPQSKQRKEHEALLAKMKRGDRVMTTGGIFGEIESLKENFVILKIDPNHDVTLKINRNAIRDIVAAESSDTEAKQ